MFNLSFLYQKKSGFLSLLFAGMLVFAAVLAGPASVHADTGFSGLVTNLLQEPLSGIQVQVLDPIDGSALADPVTTGADGTYSYLGIPAGPCKVKFQTTDINDTTNPAIFYNNQYVPEKADTLVIADGVVTPGVNAVLGAWGDITGKVVNSAAAGIQGILVTVYDTAGNLVSTIPGATTKADGTFRIALVPPGSYFIRFDGNSQYAGQWYLGAVPPGNNPPVPAAAASTTPLSQVVLSAASITGKITNVSGAAVTNIQVYVYDPILNTPILTIPGTMNQADGTYAIAGVPNGNYKIGFNVGLNPAYVKQYYNGKSSIGSADVLTLSGTTKTGINAVLSAAVSPANGVCGSSNGATLLLAPSTNLCATGAASAVTGSGPWAWTCAGSNGGSTANCSALLSVGILLKKGWNMPAWTTNDGYYNQGIATIPQPADFASNATMVTSGGTTVPDVFSGMGLVAGDSFVVVGPGGDVYLLGSPFNTLEKILPGMGYWIYVANDKTITLPGNPLALTQQIPLTTVGWAQVGYWGADGVTPDVGFSCMTGAYDTLVDEAGSVYVPNSPFNTLLTVQKNKGYFIHTTASTILRYQCP
jgi:hypothetical protein